MNNRAKPNWQTFRYSAGLPGLLLLFLSIIGLSSCVQVRLLTYPPEFTYIEPESLKSTMHNMAVSMAKLDRYVQQATRQTNDQSSHQAILKELNSLDSMAVTLSTGASAKLPDVQPHPATNHLLIDDHIDVFIEQLLRARLMADAEPPNYYGIGTLTGGCNACHQLR